MTAVWVHLGTGETKAAVILDRGVSYSLLTGKLFEEDKDAVVVEIRDPTSNYDAVNVYAFGIYFVGDDTALLGRYIDTGKGPVTLSSDDTLDYFVRGTEVVDVEGMPRQGLKVSLYNTKDPEKPLHKILYWTDEGWTVIGE